MRICGFWLNGIRGGGVSNQIDDSKETINAEWAAIEKEIDGVAGSSRETILSAGIDRKEAREPIAGLLCIIFTGAFGWFLPAWQVAEDEVSKLSDAWGAVFAKYLPSDWLEIIAGNGSGGLDVEAGALKVTISVCRPRLSKTVATNIEAKSSEQVKKPAAENFGEVPRDSDGDEMRIIG